MSASKVIDKDKGWAAYFKNMARMKDARVKVGVLEDGSGGGEGGKLTVASIAAIHEFGTEDGHIPERSFVRSTFDEQRERLRGIGKQLATRILLGVVTPAQAMAIMGSVLATEMKNKITSGTLKENAESTKLAKANKGRTAKFFRKPAKNLGDALAQIGALAAVKPLIDTGRMLNSITYAVTEDGAEDKIE